MKLINWRLVIAAIFLFFVACKKPKTDIGLGLQEDQLQTNVDESTTIVAKTFKLDSVLTDGSSVSSVLLGNYTDPLIGNSKTSIYTQINLTSVSPSVDLFANTDIESCDLILKYKNYSYGTQNNVSYDVFEIIEEFHDDTIYYSNNSLSIGESIAENPTTPFKVDTIIDQGLLTIPLNSIFTDKMQQATSSELESGSAFKDYFKGIYIKSVEEDGRVLSFDLDNSLIKLNYRNNGDTTLLSYIFSLSNETKHFTKIVHDYQLPFNEDTLIDNNFVFLQGGGSLVTSISLIDLLENHEQGEIFNKVELILPVDSVALETYPKVNIAYPFFINSEGTRVFAVNDINVQSFKENAFRFNVTEYIQKVVNGELENYTINVFTDIMSTSRVVIRKDQIKLRIIHTE